MLYHSLNLRFFKSFILCIITLSSLSMAQPPAPTVAPAKPAQPTITEQDLKAFNEIEQEIDKFVASLPPEEQQAFWKDVEDLTKVMSNMDENQLIEFMEKQFQETPSPMLPPAQPPTQPEPVIAQPVKPALPVIKPEPIHKQKNALNLIDETIIKINNFLGKAQMLPQLADKINNWVQEGKLKEWAPGTTWLTFKNQVEELEHKLNKLKSVDPKTHDFTYLNDFIKNQALYNNLSKLSSTLNTYEPKIEVSFVLDKMSSPSRQALQQVINSLAEAVNILKIPQDLDAIFMLYEPRAKLIKQEEEELKKRATAARPPSKEPLVVGGRQQYPRNMDSFGRPWTDDDGFGGGYPTSYTNYPSRPSGFEPTDSFGSKPPRGVTTDGGKQPGGTPGEQVKKTDGDKKTKEDKEAKSQVEFKQEKSMQSYLDKLDQRLSELQGIMEDSKQLTNIRNHALNPGSPDRELASNTIPEANKAARESVNALRNIKRQQSKVTADQKKEAKKSVESIEKDFNKALEKSKIKEQLLHLKNNPGAMTDQKKWAYFGIEPTVANVEAARKAGIEPVGMSEEAVQKLKAEFPKPASLSDLYDKLNSLKKLFDDILR